MLGDKMIVVITTTDREIKHFWKISFSKLFSCVQDTESNGKKIYCESLHQLMDN